MFWTELLEDPPAFFEEQDKNNKINNLILNSMRDQAKELSELLVNEKFDIDYLGKLMDIGWNYKKQLASKVSNEFIDECYSLAKNAGALGGKISGAGGGGFLLIIAKNENKKNIIQEMKKRFK